MVQGKVGGKNLYSVVWDKLPGTFALVAKMNSIRVLIRVSSRKEEEE